MVTFKRVIFAVLFFVAGNSFSQIPDTTFNFDFEDSNYWIMFSDYFRYALKF